MKMLVVYNLESILQGTESSINCYSEGRMPWIEEFSWIEWMIFFHQILLDDILCYGMEVEIQV
jgi:hypothetical protein